MQVARSFVILAQNSEPAVSTLALPRALVYNGSIMNEDSNDSPTGAEETREANLQASRRLAAMIECRTRKGHQEVTAVPGLSLFRQNSPTEPNCYMFTPHLCLVAQGVKRILLGDESYPYDALSYVVTSVDLPLASHIVEATPEKPYLGLTLELDLKEISGLMLQDSLTAAASGPINRGIGVSKTTPELLNAVERLVGLLDAPQEIPVFGHLIRHEIYCRLLMDANQGPRLRQIVIAKSRGRQIAKAIDWMKAHYNEPLSIKELAQRAGMSPSAFHQHFRSLTSISPLQFQKRIRLNEARRLMLAENMDAGNASYLVGYESPTQFNREYKRMFGNPPRTDIKNLQAAQG